MATQSRVLEENENLRSSLVSMLSDMVPQHVFDQIAQGETPATVFHDFVVVYFCDIQGFTSFSASRGPYVVLDSENFVSFSWSSSRNKGFSSTPIWTQKRSNTRKGLMQTFWVDDRNSVRRTKDVNTELGFCFSSITTILIKKRGRSTLEQFLCLRIS